jgi:hypothetical protein
MLANEEHVGSGVKTEVSGLARHVRFTLKAEVAASFDHRTAHRESRKAPQSRHDLVVHVD